jgi:hypothetical protein
VENKVDKVAVSWWTSKTYGRRKKLSSCNPPPPRGQRFAVQGKVGSRSPRKGGSPWLGGGKLSSVLTTIRGSSTFIKQFWKVSATWSYLPAAAAKDSKFLACKCDRCGDSGLSNAGYERRNGCGRDEKDKTSPHSHAFRLRVIARARASTCGRLYYQRKFGRILAPPSATFESWGKAKAGKSRYSFSGGQQNHTAALSRYLKGLSQCQNSASGSRRSEGDTATY